MTDDDFARWLTPPVALARMDATWSVQVKRDWIVARLETGRIRACSDGVLIPQHYWTRPWHWIEGSFWQTGDITFFDTPADIFGRPIPGFRGQLLRYLDTRLDPAPFAAAAPAPADARQDARSLPDEAAIMEFCRSHLRDNPRATRDEAMEAARQHFPENKVPRDWFRSIFKEVRGDRKPGPIPKSGN
jgi:hypothetical protein